MSEERTTGRHPAGVDAGGLRLPAVRRLVAGLAAVALSGTAPACAPAVVWLDGGALHDLPSTGDCEACHGAGRTPVLGFSALQLSPTDPLAPHAEPLPQGAVDLTSAVRTGMVRRLPRALLEAPPGSRRRPRSPVRRSATFMATAGGATMRAVRLGSLGLDLVQRLVPRTGEGPLATAVAVPSRYQPPGAAEALLRLAPGQPSRSALLHRLSSRAPADQMPPIGTHLVDASAVRPIGAWIAGLQPTTLAALAAAAGTPDARQIARGLPPLHPAVKNRVPDPRPPRPETATASAEPR